ncbi:hypothetical protein ACWC0A_22400 [Streptomyces scopuliridis]
MAFVATATICEGLRQTMAAAEAAMLVEGVDAGQARRVVNPVIFGSPQGVDAYVRAAEELPPPLKPADTLPLPEFPGRGVVRWSCLSDCGWHHDEDPGAEPGPWPPGPVGRPHPEEVSAAIGPQVDARHRVMLERDESALWPQGRRSPDRDLGADLTCVARRTGRYNAPMKQINVRVDEDAYAGIEARAVAAGMTVPEFARQVIADEANDLRHRFLAAGAHFSDAWTDTFATEFGHPGSEQHGAAAA